MRRLTIRITSVFWMLVILTGCNAFFEANITNQSVTLLAPTSGVKTEIATQTFLWEQIDGASDYRLQIVSPSFDSIRVMVLDTIISTDKFSYVLFPSVFEWRVRAQNSVYQSSWALGKLQIYSTTDLTGQKVNLLSPGTITNSNTVNFQWDILYNANHYTLVVYKDLWQGSPALNPTVVDTTFLTSTLTDGNYLWGVKAQNSTSETLYSQKSLIVDSTPPTQPVLSAPSNGSVGTSKTISFTWNSSDLTSGISQDTLKVFSDINLSTLVKSVATASKSAQITFTNPAVYYWTVRSVDKAGNVSLTSNAFGFTIN